MTIKQTGQQFTVDCTSEGWKHGDGMLDDSFVQGPTWNKIINVTYPTIHKTNTGSVNDVEKCSIIYWSDRSVWCKGLKIGDDDCGGHGMPPSPRPRPTPIPPTPPPTPFKPDPRQFQLSLHLIEHTHDDVGWNKDIPDYYTSEVRNIINIATQGLAQDRTRRFICEFHIF